jgi:hypothetical protein
MGSHNTTSLRIHDNRTDTILIFQHSDINAIKLDHRLQSYQHYLVLNPGLAEEAISIGLNGVEYLSIDVGRDFQARVQSEALALSSLIDQRLTREREAIFPGKYMTGWDIGVFYLGLTKLLVSRNLGHFIKQVIGNRKIGLILPSSTQQMYFDCLGAAALLQTAVGDQIVCVYEYNDVLYKRAEVYAGVLSGRVISNLLETEKVSLITHLPTCFYDRNWLSAEVLRNHESTIDIPSQYWDVPINRRHNIFVPIDSAPDADIDLALEYGNRAAKVIKNTLQDVIGTSNWSQDQVSEWTHRCVWQVLNYLGLRQGLERRMPELLVADQDTGLNGPLYSIAHELETRITVFPHSCYPSIALPHGRNVTAIERSGFNTPVKSVNGQNINVKKVSFNAKSSKEKKSEINSICLLLNAMQTEGLSHVDLAAVGKFHNELKEFCQRRNIELLIRPKPSSAASNLLSTLFGVSAQQLQANCLIPLETLAKQSDLCIGFGEPSTALAVFLDHGCPAIQVNNEDWPTEITTCLPLISQKLVPLLEPVEALSLLASIAHDASVYPTLAERQIGIWEERQHCASESLFS